MERKWEPAHPDLAVRPETPLREADLSGKPWEAAPPDSHVQEFRFFDAREHTFVKKFGEQNGASQIHVRFRERVAKKSGKVTPMTEYIFFVADHATAAAIYAEVKAASSPGEVIAARLNGKFPYRQEV